MEERIDPQVPTATNLAPVQTTPGKKGSVLASCSVQVTPSVEMAIAPNPTAVNCEPDQHTAASWSKSCTLAGVHETPSAEKRIAPPTAMNCVPDQAMPFNGEEPAEWGVQSIPSGEVNRTAPGFAVPGGIPPTATNCVPDQATPRKGAETPGTRAVQVTPSGEVRMSAVTEG